MKLIRKNTYESYTYQTAEGEVLIEFENGDFQKVTFPFGGKYTRVQWCILADINTELERLCTEKGLPDVPDMEQWQIIDNNKKLPRMDV